MILFAAALIPAIYLLSYIYRKDTVEKEPLSLLIKCFFAGALVTIPAVFIEFILEIQLIGNSSFAVGSIPYAFIMGFIVAGLGEEACKYFVLKKVTWKDKNFDYLFDGIVYAVYVSLGFAALENILYVIDGGMSTALMRMFTAIPGHTCFGVYMGYYYSLAKKASIEGNPVAQEKYTRKAVLIPMFFHGVYDSLIMTDPEVIGTGLFILCAIIWVALVIWFFRKTFLFVNQASKNDFCFYKNDEINL